MSLTEDSCGRLERNLGMFKGVLTREMMVLMALFFIIFSKRRAKATKGMIWPCAMKGNITILRFLGLASAIAEGRKKDRRDLGLDIAVSLTFQIQTRENVCFCSDNEDLKKSFKIEIDYILGKERLVKSLFDTFLLFLSFNQFFFFFFFHEILLAFFVVLKLLIFLIRPYSEKRDEFLRHVFVESTYKSIFIVSHLW